MKHKTGKNPAAGRADTRIRRSGFLRLMGAGVVGGGSGLSTGRTSAQESLTGPAPADADVSDKFSIGILADCQYADVETTPQLPHRLYRRSPQKLADAIQELTRAGDLEFLLHLGDAIDQQEKSFRVVVPLLKAAPVPVFQVAGNHDYSVADPLKEKVPELLGMPSAHYAKERGIWRFLFLDGNELSLFSSPAGSPANLAASEFQKASRRGLQAYTGGLGERQRGWLREQLSAARTAKQKVAVVCHYPLLPVDVHSLWDGEAVEKLVEEFRDVVAVWFNGHNHAGNYCARHGIHFLNLRGMVETETNAFARADFYAERIEITGHGREPSRTLKFPAEDATPENPPVLGY